MDAVARTKEGLAAFRQSVTAALSEPERAAFVLAHDAAVLARLVDRERAAAILEPAAVGLLSLTVLRRAHPDLVPAAWVVSQTANQVTRSVHPSQLATSGIVSNGLATAAMGTTVTTAFPDSASPGVAGTLARGVVAFAGYRWARHAVADSLVAAVCLALGSDTANDPRLRQHGVSAQGISHGANLLYAGEALGLVRATVLANRRGWLPRVVSAAAFSARALGGMLVVDGITQAE